ncbi:MAG: hypothetical protein ACLUIQ_11860 [Dialister invisus]
MQKTKILAVAPYEGMADAISAIAQTRDDIRMTVQAIWITAKNRPELAQ